MEPPSAPPPPPSRRELAAFFLRLGTTAFGGPAAHVALMEDELVRRRRWVARDAFLDLLAVSNLLPGPSSTELAIFIGYRLRGLAGLVIAGVCFVGPAAVMVATLAWAYVRYGRLPAVAGVLYGVKPVVIAVVVQAVWRLGRSAVKSRSLAVLGGLALAAGAAGVPPLALFAATGIAAAAVRARHRAAGLLPAVPLAGGGAVAAVSLTGILLVFLKLGAVVFGSGYVLLAFLREDLVVRRHWLTEPVLLDAVAVGQVTPGPVFTTATFIGYVLAGPAGAAVATVAIFAPGFALVAVVGPWMGALRRSATAAAVLDGLNMAAVAVMASVVVQLARAALVDGTTVGLAVLAAAALLGLGANSTWVIAAGAAVGAVRAWRGHP